MRTTLSRDVPSQPLNDSRARSSRGEVIDYSEGVNPRPWGGWNRGLDSEF
jgi:hypothetical protein